MVLTVIGSLIQLVYAAILVYLPEVPIGLGMFLCFLFGFANSAHMLCFSRAATWCRRS